MSPTPLLRLFSTLSALLAACVLTAQTPAAAPASPALALPKQDKALRASTVPRIEVRQLVDLLERYHYEHDKIRPKNYVQVIPEFMEDLDGQKLFFLATDRTSFEEKHGSALPYNLRDVGNIDAAFEIFAVYDQRVSSRLAWIFEELAKDQDFTAKDHYRADRSKSDWPESVAAADELWRKRIKYELLAELMDKKTIEQAREKVRKRYERMQKNLAEFENSDIGEIFLSSFTRLFDPHSVYFSSDSFEDFGIQMKLKLVGIGAVLSVEDDVCVIKEIIPGGPADLDKRIKPNDKILAVAQGDGEPVDIIGMKLRKIVDMIRGNKGTKVRLTVQPADDTVGSIRKEIVITRDVVKLNSARAHGAVFDIPAPADQPTVGPSKIGVITLPSFYGGDDSDDKGEKTSCSKDVAELVARLKKEEVQAIVLDLRRNGGGLLHEAVAIAGLFINSGPVVQVRDSGGSILVDADEDPTTHYEGPLAVLVDRFSASASEIVAGALQNYGRAVVVGDSSTHGKGSVQQIIEMRRVIPTVLMPRAKTGATKLTIQKFYLPSGASTQRKGVIPDVVLPSVEELIPNIGEGDLKHALVWDEIPPSLFDGKPLPKTVSEKLLALSKQRQSSLEEFAFLQTNIDWYKSRLDQKLISLNLEERLKQREADELNKKNTKAERLRLEAGNFNFREVRLVPAPPPRIKAETKSDDASPLDEDSEDNEGYARLDVHLRETLRILNDAISMGRDPGRWSLSYAPLTAQATRRNALSN